jgi:hypothetical protein
MTPATPRDLEVASAMLAHIFAPYDGDDDPRAAKIRELAARLAELAVAMRTGEAAAVED